MIPVMRRRKMLGLIIWYLCLGTSVAKGDPIKELVSPDIAGTVWKLRRVA